MNYIYIFTKEIDEFNIKAVFLSDKQEKRFVAKREKFEHEGYELMCDSATSLEQAYRIAIENEAYPDYCVNCSSYVETALYQGKRYDDQDERFYPFNGYLCEGCGTDHMDIEARRVADYKPKLS